MASGNRKTADKRALYVGGLDKHVTEQALYTAFVSFGPIKSVQIPTDYSTRTSVALMCCLSATNGTN